MDYQQFLERKKLREPLTGIRVNAQDLHPSCLTGSAVLLRGLSAWGEQPFGLILVWVRL